jgi:uncharacterized protein
MAGDPVETRETHISRVLLSGDRAYKLKKPLRLPFLDYGTLERRHEMCREEVRLNRRLAPDIYLGVRAVMSADELELGPEDAPGAVDYAVEMRRYDEDSTLASRLAAGTAGEREVRAIGRRIAAFHAGAAQPPHPERTVAALEATLRENFATLRGLDADRALIDDAERLAHVVLDGRRDELLRRARAGLVRDGHGDLRAEHVVLERGIEIVDCVEFDPGLREIDVGFDLAFLAMDLMRRDERLARALVSAYREAGGDPGDDALIDFFAAQRALIRAKVALVRAAQVAGADASRRRADAGGLLALAGRLGWRVRIVRGAIVCGVAASGKSTLAATVAERTGAVVLSSDIVRKELLGIEPVARAPDSAYDAETNRRTYAELGRRARELLDAGEPVLVDATFRHRADREAFGAADDLVWVECRAPVGVLARRAAARAHETRRVSDAGPDVAVAQAGEWEPLDEVPADRRIELDTNRALEDAVAALRDVLNERLAANYGAGPGCEADGCGAVPPYGRRMLLLHAPPLP